MSKRSRYNRARDVRNFAITTGLQDQAVSPFRRNGKKTNLASYINPVQLQRLRTDVSMWRDAMREAEQAYYPFRVKMQRIYIDTILNGHVFSLMERRKDLTLLRKYAIQNKNGVESKELTDFFLNATWFDDFMSYALDAIFFGYSLISLGDIVNDQVQEVSIIPRWFVSPDRNEVGHYIYSPAGVPFLEEPYAPWHVYVKTKSDHGISGCGYGIFYQIALYEIFLRNTLGFNGDFVELYAMPYRIGKTSKTSEDERRQLEEAVKNMGSAGYAILDPMDEITFLETNFNGGSMGYMSYESLEKRCEEKVSRIILGHSDAVSSTPGKLGAEQGGDLAPAYVAMRDKQSKDGKFMETLINEQLIPKLQDLGILKMPEGYSFQYLNNAEEEEFRRKADESNQAIATIAETMKKAGLQMDAAYFSERTGIEATLVPDPVAVKSDSFTQ